MTYTVHYRSEILQRHIVIQRVDSDLYSSVSLILQYDKGSHLSS